MYAHRQAALARAVLAALRRLSAKAANLQAQQAAVEKAEATRKQADLLTANLHRCQPGATSVEVRVTLLSPRSADQVHAIGESSAAPAGQAFRSRHRQNTWLSGSGRRLERGACGSRVFHLRKGV